MAAVAAVKPGVTAVPAKPGAVAEAKPAKAKKNGVSIVVLLVIVLLACAATGAATWFLVGRKAATTTATTEKSAERGDSGEKAESGKPDGVKKPGQAEYLALDPAFVVNTADEDSQHYLQTDVQVMARNEAALDAVKTHMPRIRNNLLMLFGQQRTADIRDRAGRERLRAAALKEVQDVLQAETGKPGVEALYFTSFVTQ